MKKMVTTTPVRELCLSFEGISGPYKVLSHWKSTVKIQGKCHQITLAQTYFVVHIAAQERRIDSGVAPGVRLHAVSTLSSQAGC